MRATRHREMRASDFYLLARFSYNVSNNRCDCVPLALGEIMMRIPVWTNSHGVWKVAKLKNVKQEALGLAPDAFRRICRYMQVKESEALKTLYNFSILGVDLDQSLYSKLRLRQFVGGLPLFVAPQFRGYSEDDLWACGEAFVLERRRILGDFRSKKPDQGALRSEVLGA